MSQLASEGVCVATTFSPWLGFNLHVPPGVAADLISKPDAVHAAAQLGRLDFLTGILASLTILLTVSALVGFWTMWHSVLRQAKAAAEAEIRLELPKLLPKHFAEHPRIIVEALKNDTSLVRIIAESYNSLYGNMTDFTAQNVMTSLEEGVNNGNAG